MREKMRERNSATAVAIHIPSEPRNRGITRMQIIWKTRVLRKDMSALTRPLFRAVKNDEENIEKPQKRNDIE